ncbi:MAG: NADH-quinone oxidoreductase subunit F, partial [Syntrophomonadaceae bacterium]|nr:NADH-quinone oxidoreductase subunit F [Syntrophomonadaceae bacterium]
MAEELRIVLRNADRIDPLNIDDYLAAGGYRALEKARGMNPKDLINEVKASNLRGRGGAGFNAGLKWSFVPPADVTYVVCNLDEGEPGTYKDRTIVEKDPQSLLEGMAICAHAIGSRQGFIYCRGEYPYVVEHLRKAIAQARDKGVLGDFDIQVRMGAGAYVCGEETALIESIEGHRGEPRFKPPFPGVAGLWG